MTSFDWADWTDWHSLATVDFKTVPTGPGVYVISTGNKVNRIIGEDSEGILTIGESGELRSRLRAFMGCAGNYGREGHIAGYRFSFFRFARHFPLDSLRIRWREADTKKAAYEIEGRMLLSYLMHHSELPPLNYSFNWSPFKADDWKLFDRMIAKGES